MIFPYPNILNQYNYNIYVNNEIKVSFFITT